MAHYTQEKPYEAMSSPRQFSHSLDLEDPLHADDASDTTLASDSFLSKPHNHHHLSSHPSSAQQARSQRLQTVLTWVRWAVVVFFQGVIIVLLLPTTGMLGEDASWASLGGVVHAGKGKGGGGAGWKQEMTETGGDVNGLYVPTSHTYTLLTPDEEKFMPNMTSDEDRMAIRRNWDLLMPLGSGSVLIPDYEQHPLLGKPIVTDPIHSGPVFEASWTHALHCLYYTVDTYHQLATSNGTKFGFDGERNDMHASHCFEYLRNQILCMADMTLEGSESLLDATGEGQPHMCRNREEAVGWIEERRMDDLQSIVGPTAV